VFGGVDWKEEGGTAIYQNQKSPSKFLQKVSKSSFCVKKKIKGSFWHQTPPLSPEEKKKPQKGILSYKTNILQTLNLLKLGHGIGQGVLQRGEEYTIWYHLGEGHQ